MPCSPRAHRAASHREPDLAGGHEIHDFIGQRREFEHGNLPSLLQRDLAEHEIRDERGLLPEQPFPVLKGCREDKG